MTNGFLNLLPELKAFYPEKEKKRRKSERGDIMPKCC